MKTPTKVFITYSHKNTDKRERLEAALAVMINNGEIEMWCDAEISPGDKWEQKISEKLKESDILLYLVSVDSLASKNCNEELTDVVEAFNIPVIPIILEDCDFEFHSLAEFEALPIRNKNIVPISRWRNHSEAWQNVVEGIRNAIACIPGKPTPSGSNIPPSTPKGPQPTSLTREQEAAGFFNRANFFLMLGNHDLAFAGYAKSIALNPDYALAYNNRGIVYGKEGDYDRAIANFNKAIELNPNLVEAYTNRGNAYNGKCDYDRAIVDFNKAIELNPNLAEIYTNRGNAYDSKGKSDRAIADHNKAIELNPNLVEAYTNRGNAYSDKGEYDRAIADQNKAIKLNPNYAGAYNNRGNAKVMSTSPDLKGAIADYDKAIKLNPNFALAYFNRANAKQRNQDIEGAMEDLKTTLRLAEQQGNKEIFARIQEKIANPHRPK